MIFTKLVVLISFILIVIGGMYTLPPFSEWTTVDYTFALMMMAILIPALDKLGKKNGNDSNKGPTLP